MELAPSVSVIMMHVFSLSKRFRHYAIVLSFHSEVYITSIVIFLCNIIKW